MAGLIPYRCSPPPPPPPPGLDLLFITSSVSPLYYSLGLNASRRSSSHRVEASKPPGQSVTAPLTDCRPSLRLRRCQISAAWRSPPGCASFFFPWPDDSRTSLRRHRGCRWWEAEPVLCVLVVVCQNGWWCCECSSRTFLDKAHCFEPLTCLSVSRIWFKGPRCVVTIAVIKARAKDTGRAKTICLIDSVCKFLIYYFYIFILVKDYICP